MTAVYNAGDGSIDVFYTPACDADGHIVYWGDLAAVSSYGYSDAVCVERTSGQINLPSTPDAIFFVVAAYNDTLEGSYGVDSALVERPEATGIPGCDYTQDLNPVCE